MTEATPSARLDEAIARVSSTQDRRDYIRRAQWELLRLLERNGRATIEEIRDACPVPTAFKPTILGAVTKLLAKDGVIQSAGFVRGTRRLSHGRPISVWRLTADLFALAEWKAANSCPL